ncbi:HD domain-containing phosphohydrolase [Opacimonas viscosa]|uniref:Response regulator n=1 Tax=Opacimonas viscosa TaxID=2961944 RepID=A0AA41WYE8_9ALTE|nr:HD domain-containing phosphohydrolase [Opacimonas viscosa]MCP3428824.1 response regulator [Opacimonas viscosa]
MTQPNKEQNKMTAGPTFTVLFVDDETSILRSIKRIFHRTNINMLFATSGQEALELFAENDIAMIVSDMKMPNMTGADLLAKVAELYPDTYRVILTGFADLDSIMKAVNQGGIHRYIQKPWDNQNLLLTIKDGLKYTKLKQENVVLQNKLFKQNRALKELNSSLDKKVATKTQQIQLALKKLKQEQVASEKMLFNCISVHPELDGGFAQSVSRLATEIAEKLHLEPKMIKAVKDASLLCQIGLLGKEVHLFNTAFNELNYEQQKAYVRQVDVANMMLSPLTHAQPIVDIIYHQFEYYNGQGYPNMKVADDIPIGARILFIARDFWRYRIGKMTGKHLDAIDARIEMSKHKGTKYDPRVYDIFTSVSLADQVICQDGSFNVNNLKPGMELARDIYNAKYVLMLPEGHVFTDATIQKLKHYELNHKEELKLFIKE